MFFYGRLDGDLYCFEQVNFCALTELSVKAINFNGENLLSSQICIDVY